MRTTGATPARKKRQNSGDVNRILHHRFATRMRQNPSVVTRVRSKAIQLSDLESCSHELISREKAFPPVMTESSPGSKCNLSLSDTNLDISRLLCSLGMGTTQILFRLCCRRINDKKRLAKQAGNKQLNVSSQWSHDKKVFSFEDIGQPLDMFTLHGSHDQIKHVPGVHLT